MVCSIDGCEKVVRARGWCHAHYMRWYKRGGDPSQNRRLKEFRPPPKSCALPGCNEPVEAWGWCLAHYAIAKQNCKICYRECQVCGTPFTARRTKALFCSKKCKVEQRRRDGRMAASVRKSYMKSEWGMTPEDYHRMLSGQGGGCAICGTFDPRGRGRFHVDHDHATGRIRGLLCNECNFGLGKFGDNPELLRRALAYLAS